MLDHETDVTKLRNEETTPKSHTRYEYVKRKLYLKNTSEMDTRVPQTRLISQSGRAVQWKYAPDIFRRHDLLVSYTRVQDEQRRRDWFQVQETTR